jgi:hypothetical protein
MIDPFEIRLSGRADGTWEVNIEECNGDCIPTFEFKNLKEAFTFLSKKIVYVDAERLNITLEGKAC